MTDYQDARDETDALGGRYTPTGGPSLTRVGYGARQLTGPHAWGPPADRQEAIRVLRAAVDAGVNHIDTADFYGPHVANQIIAEALAPYTDDVHVVTKVGSVRDDDGGWRHARAPRELREQVESNLRALGMETLDVVNLRVGGGPDGHSAVPGSIAEPFGALVDMQRAGMIRHVGLSTVDADQVREAQSIAPIVTVQNWFNLAHRGDEALIASLNEQGIAYVPFWPLGGISPLRSAVLDAVAADLHQPAMTVALAWLLHRSPNILLIPGTASVAHLRQNLAAATLHLDESTMARLDAVGEKQAALR